MIEFYEKFMMWFNQFDETRKKQILRDIFELDNVSVYSISGRDDRVVFHFFVENIFYQFVFMENDIYCDDVSIKVSSSCRFVIYQVSIGTYFSIEKWLRFYEGKHSFYGLDEGSGMK